MKQQIAIVMTEVFLRRLTPALMAFAGSQQDFRVLRIGRPLNELKEILDRLRPSGLITEWLPGVTDDLVALGLPTVIADTDIQYPGVVSIDVDDRGVGAEAAEAFSQAGFRSLACLGNGMPYSDQRIQGFEAVVGHSVPVHIERSLEKGHYSEHFAEMSPKMRRWLASLPKPVGVFAVHDPLGRFLCGSCQELGIDVPGEVAVIGANNDESVCGLTYPMLSSVAIPWDRIGAQVGESMQGLLSGAALPDVPILVAPGGVVLRHSADHLVVEDAQLRRAMSYLSEHLQDPITIQQLCDELRLARRSLEQKFNVFYQCTPWEMLCRLRVGRAKQLLSDTNHPISLISELCGFNDPERMAVVFKRVAGVPPSRWRKGRGGVHS